MIVSSLVISGEVMTGQRGFGLIVNAPSGATLNYAAQFAGGDVLLDDGVDLQIGAGVGTKIGTAITDKLAFHNSTPVGQRAGAAQAAVATTGATSTTPFGYTTAAQADAIVTLVNEIRAALVEKGLMKGAA